MRWPPHLQRWADAADRAQVSCTCGAPPSRKVGRLLGPRSMSASESTRPPMRWSPADLRILRTAYKRGYAACMKALPGRTYEAIKAKARELGMVPKRRLWTAREVTHLRVLHRRGLSNLQIAYHLRLRPDQVAGALRYHGMRRDAGELAQTSSSLLDDIRERANQRGISLSKLNREVCAGHVRIFTAGLRTKIDPKWLFRAVNYLGGSVEAVWDFDD